MSRFFRMRMNALRARDEWYFIRSREELKLKTQEKKCQKENQSS